MLPRNETGAEGVAGGDEDFASETRVTRVTLEARFHEEVAGEGNRADIGNRLNGRVVFCLAYGSFVHIRVVF